MSQIKKAGFTIVEILIAVVILVTVILIGFNLIFSAVSSNSKTNVLNEIRQNGNHVLEVIEPIIGSASKIECIENKITVHNSKGESTYFNESSERIASGSFYLTDDNLVVSKFIISCSTSPGLPAKVDVSFTIEKKGEYLRTSENASRDFQTEIILKNFE